MSSQYVKLTWDLNSCHLLVLLKSFTDYLKKETSDSSQKALKIDA